MNNHSELKGEIEDLISYGYKTIKVKIGRNVEEDIKKIRYVQELVGEKAQLRLDANRAYSYEDALKFVNNIDPINIELVEQPFPIDAWDQMDLLVKNSPIPLMLDESIYNEVDIERVVNKKCATYVKFKLMKAGSFERLERFITKAQSGGLKVVLGNGIAGEIGNIHEILIARNLLNNAGEMNGFMKIKGSLLEKGIEVNQGIAKIPSGFKIKLNEEAIKRYSVKKV